MQKCLVVRTAITHGQNVSRNCLMLTACEITHCIINSHLRRNSIGYLWNDSGSALHIKLLHLGGMDPILRVSRALQDVRVCVCMRAGVGSGLDWVSWHDRRANAGNKSVSLTRCLSSSDIPRCPHQLRTNKDVWEENRSDHSRCQGEMHLVSGEICQVWEVHQEWLPMSLLFKSGADTAWRHFHLQYVNIHLNLKNLPYHQTEVQVL